MKLQPEEVEQILADWVYAQIGDGRVTLRHDVNERLYQGDYIGHEIDLFLEVEG